MGGGVVAEFFSVHKSVTFPRFRDILAAFSGHLRINRRLWTLTQIQAHFPGLLAHSNHVTTSIHSRKKTFTKSLGAPWLRHCVGSEGTRGRPLVVFTLQVSILWQRFLKSDESTWSHCKAHGRSRVQVPPLQPRVQILAHVAQTPKTEPQLPRQILTINRNIPSDASTKTLLVILLKHFPKLV